MTGFGAFRDLHHSDTPLFLPNAWDYASAAALVERGFTALGTTSLGVAVAAGLQDGQGATRDETFRLAEGLTRLPALISVDIEGGFSEDPGEVASYAAELARVGVVGINIEDGRADGTLLPHDHQAEIIRAVKAAAPRLFVNARTDVYWIPGSSETPDKTVRERADAYLQAGADGIFVPGVTDAAAISLLVNDVQAPLNILFSPQGRHSLQVLAGLGVRRVSTGSLLFRAAINCAVELAWDLLNENEHGPTNVPSYADAQDLATPFSQDDAPER